jgi:hypothetical protein
MGGKMSYLIREAATLMKKTPAVIILLSLILMLSGACSNTSKVNTSAELTPKISEAAEETGKELSRGTWNDDVYTNEFAGIQFTLPEGWLVATDEEIANIMGMGAEVMGDDAKWAMEAAKQASIYDMMAQDPVKMNNVSIMFQNLSMSVGGTNISEKDYLEILEAQMKGIETLDYTYGDPYETTINGVTFQTLRAETNNIAQYYMVHRQDKYMVAVILTLVDDTDIEDILAQFI